MNTDIYKNEIIKELENDRNLGFVKRGEYLRKGTCPNCAKKELFIRIDEPWQVKCSREGKCGYIQTTRERYDYIFADYAKKFPATQTQPNATADAYLAHNRGFDLVKINGLYEQKIFKDRVRNEYYETIRFYLDSNKTRYWERVLDHPEQKANFGGRRKKDGSLYKGDCFVPFALNELKKFEEIYVVEGIFHALAFNEVGKKAIATLSCSNFPIKFIEKTLSLSLNYVVAFDNDEAGRKSTQRFLSKMDKKIAVAFSPFGDWDDVFRDAKLDKHYLEKAKIIGGKFSAKSIIEKAYYCYLENSANNQVIEFRGALFSIKTTENFFKELCALNDGAKSRNVFTLKNSLKTANGSEIFARNIEFMKITNFSLELLYKKEDYILDESFYVFKVTYADFDKTEVVSVKGSALKDAGSFKNQFFSASNQCHFSGKNSDLDYLITLWFKKWIKKVKSVPFVGYIPQHKVYIFKDIGFSNGKIIKMNDNNFLDFEKFGLTSSLNLKDINLEINPENVFKKDWILDYIDIFSYAGFSLLVFFAISLFACQIREKLNSLFFFELTGEPGAGKSTLIEFCWKLLGRQGYEGEDSTKGSLAADRRKLSQFSNMPYILIEADSAKDSKGSKKTVNFDQYKTFYNGRSTGSLGVAKQGNDTVESMFQSALAFAQNDHVQASEALMERIVYSHMDKKHHNKNKVKKARDLTAIDINNLSGFIVEVLGRESELLDTYFKEFEKAESFLMQFNIRRLRLVKNNAQMLAGFYILQKVFPLLDKKIEKEFKQYVVDIMINRSKELMLDSAVVEEFWDTVEYLENINIEVNHSMDEKLIAININDYTSKAVANFQRPADKQDLKKELRSSNRYKFVEYATIKSKLLNQKRTRCYIFKK